MKILCVYFCAAVLGCIATTSAHAQASETDGWHLHGQVFNLESQEVADGVTPYSGSSKASADGNTISAESKNADSQAIARTHTDSKGRFNFTWDYVYSGAAPSATPTVTIETKAILKASLNFVGYGSEYYAESAGNNGNLVKSSYLRPDGVTSKNVTDTIQIGGDSAIQTVIGFNAEVKTGCNNQGSSGTASASVDAFAKIKTP